MSLLHPGENLRTKAIEEEKEENAQNLRLNPCYCSLAHHLPEMLRYGALGSEALCLDIIDIYHMLSSSFTRWHCLWIFYAELGSNAY